MAISGSKVVKIAVGIGTIAALVALGGGLQEQIAAFQRFSSWWLLAAALIYMVDRVVMTGKWWQLLRLRSRSVGFVRAHSIYQTCNLWGLVMPATVGGDALRVLCLAREGVSSEDAIASIVVERLAGLLALMTCVAAASLSLSMSENPLAPSQTLLMLTALGALVVVIAGAASISPIVPRLITGPLVARWPDNRIVRSLMDLHVAYSAFSRAKFRVGWLLVLSIIEIALTVVFYWGLLAALGHDMPVDFIALATMGAFLASRIPITLGGLGVFEASMTGLLALADVPVADSLAVSLTGRLVHIACWMPWVSLYVIGTPRNDRLAAILTSKQREIEDRP